MTNVIDLTSKPLYILKLTARQHQQFLESLNSNDPDIKQAVLYNNPVTSLQAKHVQKLVQQQQLEILFYPYLIWREYIKQWYNLGRYPK